MRWLYVYLICLLFERSGKNERGATVVEYGILASIIAIAAIAVIILIGDWVASAFQGASNAFDAGQ